MFNFPKGWHPKTLFLGHGLINRLIDRLEIVRLIEEKFY